ncbi:TonB-linked SusC/RagA family outer membrane protein [Maribacter vaceletii]|uniref:TonB-linked SusC/RagA family outer membrane protein n=1 Tax=Maribacter vaceletii TaxID=1206816 RepID=A0A495EES6_9FLAO|nr:TonB-dependent receptor [Maribacter vaceletii]RKR14387.1 TonB-linked SusC/RagA family outer membrane protein [Maribacter vaceletii]
MKRINDLWRNTFFIMLFFLFLCIPKVYAQENVSGQVVDDLGLPLPGVSVVVDGTTTGAVADIDGNYTVSAKKGAVLVFSYIGFKTVKKTVNSSTINVKLFTDTEALEEVVVVGYGTQKKKEVTGAVANLKADEIIKTAVSDLGAAIQGKVAGINVQAASGRPGESANIQIRGLGSLSAGLEPLYVVDGIPYEGNPNIAPEQIESIDVLKDGASTSIYGNRASNGVILISTKKGKAGKVQVDVNSYTGVQNITSGTPLMNTVEQLYTLEVVTEQLGNQPQTFFFNPNALDFDTEFVPDVQNDNAIIQNHGINISGGVENLTLNFNTNYFKQEGVLINSGFNRLSNRLTGQFTKGKFKAFASVGYTVENRDQEPFALYEYSIGQAPWARPFNEIPSAGENSFLLDESVDNDIFYSFISRTLNNIDERETKRTNLALKLDYEIADGLKYSINLGRNDSKYFRKFFRPQYLAIRGDGTLNETASVPQALLDETHNTSERSTIENVLNYSITLNKHKLNFTGVLSYEEFNRKDVRVGVVFSDNSSNSLQTLGSGAEGIKPATYNETSTLSGKLARIQYNYDDKYLLSASYRRDGSSKFSKANRYGDFFGFSAGWNIHEENWFNIPAVSNLKLRASWAEVGNNRIPSYLFTPLIEAGANYPFGPDEDLLFGQTQRRYVDPNIKWETTISKNIGLDLSLFKDKLSLTAEVYQNDKKDMLLGQSIPASTGTSQPRASGTYDQIFVNAGNMVNEGIEISINYKGQIGNDFKYSLNGTFTKNRNEVLDLNGVERGYANGRPLISRGNNTEFTTFLAEGYEAGAFFLYQQDGVIKTPEELEEYSQLDLRSVSTPQLGDMRYKDVNNDNIIDENDRAYSGSGQPEFEAGLGLDMNYKGFDFGIQSYLSYGAEVYNGAKLYAYSGGRHKDLVNMWSPQNPTSNIPTFRQNSFHSNVRAGSNLFLEDGTYLRIRSLTVGYTIPDLEKSGIKKARIYVTSVNPFTFTNYDGYDPEVGGDGLFFRGVDRGNYPVSRQFMLGAQLSF